MDITLDLAALLAASLKMRAQCNADLETCIHSRLGPTWLVTIDLSGAIILHKEDALGRLQAAVIGQAYPPDQVCFTQLAWPDEANGKEEIPSEDTQG